MYITSDDGYQNFVDSASMLISLILDSNKKVNNWILTGISSEKMKPFDTGLEPTMSNLAYGRVNSKYKNVLLVQKGFSSSLYSNFILNLYIVYELNHWPRNPANNFTPKNCLFGTDKLVRNTIKSKFTCNAQEIAFDGEDSWSFVNDIARNVVIFWC